MFKLTGETDPRWEEREDADFMRGLRSGDFLLELYQLNQFQSSGSHENIGYRLIDDTVEHLGVVFDGHDVGIPRGSCLDSAGSFESVLGFLSMKKGDVEEEYWKEHGYTPKQLEWRDARAEELSKVQLDLSEMLGKIWNDEVPPWACTRYSEDEHEWMNCENCQKHNERQAFDERPFSPIHIALLNGKELMGLLRFPDDTYDSQAKKAAADFLEREWHILGSGDEVPDAAVFDGAIKRLVEDGYEWIPCCFHWQDDRGLDLEGRG